MKISAIRWRPNGVCAQTAGDVPGGVVYVKSNPNSGGPKGAFPVRWLGCVCLCRARKLHYARKGKLIATSVTNGSYIGNDWRDLSPDEYVLAMLIQIGEAHEYGAWAVVDKDDWPIVLSENKRPTLTIVAESAPGKVVGFAR